MVSFKDWLEGAIIVGTIPKSKLKDFNIAGAAGKGAVVAQGKPPLHWVKNSKNK